jgi:hypothetical protein
MMSQTPDAEACVGLAIAAAKRARNSLRLPIIARIGLIGKRDAGGRPGCLGILGIPMASPE